MNRSHFKNPGKGSAVDRALQQGDKTAAPATLTQGFGNAAEATRDQADRWLDF